MRKNFFWPQEHNNVVRTILGKAKDGTRVIYIPGNHDDDLREFCGSVFGNLEIRREFVHVTADGRELLVMHGDEFDTVVKCSPWLAQARQQLSTTSCSASIAHVNAVRRLFGHAVLVAGELPQAQGQERRAVHRQLRAGRGARGAQARRRRRGVRSHPPRRRSATSTACSTATTAIGWRAAPRWSRT